MKDPHFDGAALREIARLEDEVRRLQRLLGRKTLEVELLRDILEGAGEHVPRFPSERPGPMALGARRA